MPDPVNEAPSTVAATPAPDVTPADVPSVREDYPVVPGQLATLAPRKGWAGVIAVVPVDAQRYRVALFVKATTKGGVAWMPERGTIVMDVPAGFSIQDGEAILDWIRRDHGSRGKPPPIGPVVD